jgi:hypothetical protein
MNMVGKENRQPRVTMRLLGKNGTCGREVLDAPHHKSTDVET